MLANRPSDPAVLFAEEIDDLLLEARNYLDGEPIATEGQADAVSSLLNRLRRVSKDADDARKAEKKPHDDACKAVQAKWKPIIDKADLAASTAKQALAPWLRQVEEKQRAEAEFARAEAERLARIAVDAHAASIGNLEEAEHAERLLKAAEGAKRYAGKVDKQKAHATGGERAVGLVDRFTAEITDPVAFGKWAWEHRREEYLGFLESLAAAECRHGNRSVPGLKINHERIAR